MKQENIIKNTVVPGTIAVSAMVLSSRIPFSAEALVGFGTVLATLGIAAVDYGFGRKA
jgi:hypothetical protein